VLVAEAPIPMDYGPWKKMSQEGVDFLQGCLDRDYHQRMTVRQVQLLIVVLSSLRSVAPPRRRSLLLGDQTGMRKCCEPFVHALACLEAAVNGDC
jgi:hypothetical protein